MNKGLTLLELQVAMLLTLLLLSVLFLFTTYFWRNHRAYNQQLTFQRESELFCLWLSQQMRNAVEVERSTDTMTFSLARGGVEQLTWREAGPMVSGLAFFSEPVILKIQLSEKKTSRSLTVKLVQEDRSFQWQQSFQNPAHLGLMEATFAN